jgi:hypothetical protein
VRNTSWRDERRRETQSTFAGPSEPENVGAVWVPAVSDAVVEGLIERIGSAVIE